MAGKLMGAQLTAAVEEANAQGAEIDPHARADDKRAALQEFHNQKESTMPDTLSNDDVKSSKPESAGAEQPEASLVDDEVKENDPVADRIAKHGETPQEEMEAQRAAVLGSVSGVTPGPSQNDLNPAYATEFVYDPEAGDDK